MRRGGFRREGKEVRKLLLLRRIKYKWSQLLLLLFLMMLVLHRARRSTDHIRHNNLFVLLLDRDLLAI